MEAPVDLSSSEEEENNDSILLPDDFDEVDIKIHFHCEHCIKIDKCYERPKQGWSCELEYCSNNCGHKFHICKTSEHRLMCSHERVPCINSSYGCSLWMQRRFLADHLPKCPASVVICNAEWNRWLLGANERKLVAMTKGVTELYNSTDLDMALALHDQDLINEMQNMPVKLRSTLCNSISKRFPCLPLTIRGSRHYISSKNDHRYDIINSTTEERKSNLTTAETMTNSKIYKDDIAAICCSHGIIKNICNLCRDDPPEPDYKMGKIWKEHLVFEKPGELKWVTEPYVEKVRKRNQYGVFAYKKYDESDEDNEEENDIPLDKMSIIVDELGHPVGKRPRFQTPPTSPLTPKDLTVELTLKHYSRYQTKPKSMFTFQCMQELRRSEYTSHYQNVHSEIQEGLDGWLIHRCPLHVIGCPFINNRLHPGKKDGDVVYSHSLKAFGVRSTLEYEPISSNGMVNSCSSSLLNRMHLEPVLQAQTQDSVKQRNKSPELTTETYLTSSIHLTCLPVELLQKITSYLDGYSLNNLSLSCQLMQNICQSLLNERGLVIIEWVRYIEDNKIRWKEGKKLRFFSKAFEHVHHWGFKEVTHMGNHLEVCKFNKRHNSEKKFAYILPSKDGTIPAILRVQQDYRETGPRNSEV